MTLFQLRNTTGTIARGSAEFVARAQYDHRRDDGVEVRHASGRVLNTTEKADFDNAVRGLHQYLEQSRSRICGAQS